jgi:transposase-like protein
MKVHRYHEQQRRQWVYEMQHKLKSVKQICREAVISRATLYNWIKEFSEENATVDNEAGLPEEHAISWQPLDKHKMLLAALGKVDKDKKISHKLVSELMKRYTLTVAQACSIAGIEETAYNYKPRKPEVADRLVYDELVRLIAEDSSRGLDDCQAVLQSTYPGWTHKQIKRIYRQGRLYLKRTRARNTRLLNNIIPQTAVPVNRILRLKREAAFWHVGVLEETLSDNNTYWLLYLIDYNDGTPLNVATGEGSLTAEHLLDFFTAAVKENGTPGKMRVLDQPPFNSREVARWIWDNKVAMYRLSMAKPENQLEIGHLQDSIRQQLIEEGTTLAGVKEKAAAWINSIAEREASVEELSTAEV